MIIDGHTDALWALKREMRPFSEESDIGHVDLPRLKKGGVGAAFFAIFPSWSDFDIYRGVDQWFKLVENPKNQLKLIKKVEDLKKCQSENKVGAILHFEGSGGLDSDLINLRNYYRLGLRSMGLSWSNVNRFATGVAYNPRTGEGLDLDRGLTSEGRELVKEMNDLGIIVDVSHLNEKSFWDVVEATTKPIIASHSNAYTVCGHFRNLKDDQIKAIAEKNGTIGLNFCVAFLHSEKQKEEIQLEDMRKHIDYIVDLVGIDHISFGSDYDGATVPDVVKDVSYFPILVKHLEDNGYSQDDIEKISSKNFLRVISDVWN
ncbi:MAG: dipeptidase [Candidatus Heimdallarchaeaceae archaeon]